jgi:DNA replication and repair protein RecF
MVWYLRWRNVYLVSDNDFTLATEEEVYYQMLERQKELFNRELDSGITLVGPHKHEISFFIDDIDTRFYASQGQQRALILAFKMAQAELITKKFGETPLLLLDDVMSELDPQKRLFLIDFLSKIDAQIVLTTTDLAYSKHFEKGDQLYQFNLKNGVIKRVRTMSDRDQSRDGKKDRTSNNQST